MSDSESDIDERHAKLIESLSKSENAEKKAIKTTKQTKVKNEITKESEYSIDTDQATINDLIGVLDDQTDLKAQASELIKGSAPISKPLSKIHKEKAAYSLTKKDVTKWQPIVKKNREAPVLNFPLDEEKRERSTLTSLAANFEPETSLETRVAEVLTKTGMSEENVVKQEDKELQSQMLTLEEIQERRRELAKIKSIIFYEEKKRQRINKIKSRMYHKIKKRQEKRQKEKEREMLRESNPELAEKMDEEDEYRRAKERMTQKHSTLNKWANRNLKYSKNNESIKEAINEHLQASEKLKRKLEKEEEVNSDLELEESLDPNMPEEERERIIKTKLIKNLEDVKDEIDNDDFDPGEHSSIYKMPFMKAAMEKKKEKLRNEAESALYELKNQLESQMNNNSTTTTNNNNDNNNENGNNENDNSQKKRKKNEGWDLNELTSTSVPTKITADNTTGDQLVVDISKIKNSNITIPNISSSKNKKEKEKEKKEEKPAKIKDKLSQEDLISRAFSMGFEEEEFQKEKEEEMEGDMPEPEPDMSGWGSWTGLGVKVNKNRAKKRKREEERIREEVTKKRKDAKLSNVIINEKPSKKFLKYTHEAIPYPFTSREQYERSIRNPLGKEWNTSEAFHKLNLPKNKVRTGAIIEPISFIVEPKNKK